MASLEVRTSVLNSLVIGRKSAKKMDKKENTAYDESWRHRKCVYAKNSSESKCL